MSLGPRTVNGGGGSFPGPCCLALVADSDTVSQVTGGEQISLDQEHVAVRDLSMTLLYEVRLIIRHSVLNWRWQNSIENVQNMSAKSIVCYTEMEFRLFQYSVSESISVQITQEGGS